ncbi:acyl-CoA dehydrogenase [compost metagenome]
MLQEGGIRDRLSVGIYMPTDKNEAIGRLEYAFAVTIKAEAAEKKVKKAIRDGVLPKKKVHLLLDEAQQKNVITADELKLIKESDAVRYDAILVDDFSQEEYMQGAKA